MSATTGGNEDDDDEDVEGAMYRGRKDRYAPFFSHLSLICLLFLVGLEGRVTDLGIEVF